MLLITHFTDIFYIFLYKYFQGVPPAYSFTGQTKLHYKNEDGFENIKYEGVVKTGYLMRLQTNPSTSLHFTGSRKGCILHFKLNWCNNGISYDFNDVL